MSLKYTANFAWDLSLGQIRTSSKEKKKRGDQRDILKSQTESYKISDYLSVWI